jgi:hypothetical protein
MATVAALLGPDQQQREEYDERHHQGGNNQTDLHDLSSMPSTTSKQGA